VTVLLGATQAGKTTLMRLMAGLDVPSRGRCGRWVDVTGLPVRQRNVAMVYQQFINYPSMTVFDNIASPLKLRGGLDRGHRQRVQALADKLHIEPFLQRLPAELSGGQQQRVALARALAKDAPLMLLDEPLVNLDYKLREELREELSALFAAGDSTVVYATTEPTEALLLGGWTAVMDAGELLQYGPTAEVFHRPASIRVAAAFSDPPMNLLDQGPRPGWACPAGSAPADATVGVRASALRVQARPGDMALPGTVELAEISGSDTFVHVHTAGRRAGGAADRRAFLRPGRRDHAAPGPGRRSMSSALTARCCVAPAPFTEGLTWPASTSTWRTATSPTRRRTATTRCCR
jgi:glycerol transport system ATP-binding protein